MPPTMEQMQGVFDLNMNPIATHDGYPRYARSETKPVVRARHIIDMGAVSDRPCSACVELGQDCYRWEEGRFGKCAYCTSKDRKKELCCLPGLEAEAPEGPKRRKIAQDIYTSSGGAANNADTMMSGPFITRTLASGFTPLPNIPMSIPRSFREQAPSPEPTFAMSIPRRFRSQAPSPEPTFAISIPRSFRSQAPSPEPTFARTETAPAQTVAPTILKAEAEASSEATLERVTALESQVSGLQSKVIDLSVKLDEVSSYISSRMTPNPQAVAGGYASPTTSDVTFQDLQARNVPDIAATTARRATIEWVQGSKISNAVSSPVETATILKVEEEVIGTKKLQHTIEHAEGYRPVNCNCTRYECGGTIIAA